MTEPWPLPDHPVHSRLFDYTVGRKRRREVSKESKKHKPHGCNNWLIVAQTKHLNCKTPVQGSASFFVLGCGTLKKVFFQECKLLRYVNTRSLNNTNMFGPCQQTGQLNAAGWKTEACSLMPDWESRLHVDKKLWCHSALWLIMSFNHNAGVLA